MRERQVISLIDAFIGLILGAAIIYLVLRSGAIP